MKFWDTIAKMCGVEVETRSGGTLIGRMSYTTIAPGCDVTFRGYKIALNYGSTSADAWLSVNGHGLRLRDSTEFKNESNPSSFRVGLIDIERTRPQTAGEVGLSQAAEMIHRAAKAMNPDGVWKYESAADKPS